MIQKMRRKGPIQLAAAVLLMVAALMLLPQPNAFAQDAARPVVLPTATDVTTQWTLDRTELAVGDPLALTLTVHHPAGTQALLPALDEAWGDFEVWSQSPVAVTENADGSLTTTQAIEATIFAPGAYRTPALAIPISDQDGNLTQADVAPVDVTVLSLLADGETELRDIKQQAALPIPTDYLPLLAGITALLVLGGFGLWLYRRRDRVLDRRTPLQRAMAELDEIERLDYPAQGNLQLHYVLTSETLRRFLQEAHGIPAPDMTTAELESTLRQTEISRPYADETVGLLADSDLVKFAKLTPVAESVRELTIDVRKLIEGMAAEAAEQEAAAQAAAAQQQPGGQSIALSA